MRPFKSILFRTGLVTLVALILLRLLGLDPTRAPAAFWTMSFAWPFLMGMAIVLEKGVSVSRGSPWGALVVITSLMAGLLTLVAMGLPMGQVTFDPILVGLLGIPFVFVCVGWWRLLRPAKPHSVEEGARPWLYIALVIVAAIGVLLDKLELI